MRTDEKEAAPRRRSRPRILDAEIDCGSSVRRDGGDWEHAHLLWRSVPAHRFHRDHRAAVAESMRRTSSTMNVWRLAIAGDAASAIGLALSIGIPEQITIRTDLTMTVLLHNALRGSAGATLVLSNLIKRMPLDRVDRRRFATLWLAHNFREAWPELDERIRHIKSSTTDRHAGGGEKARGVAWGLRDAFARRRRWCASSRAGIRLAGVEVWIQGGRHDASLQRDRT